MILAEGSESILYLEEFFGIKTVVKKRRKKAYVSEEIQQMWLRRNLNEVRLLHRAKKVIKCPYVLEVGPNFFRMTYVEGKKPRSSKQILREMGRILARLHAVDIIHGDFTLNNFLLARDGIYVIDFSLGKISKKIEDKADDLVTAFLSAGRRNEVFTGYLELGSKDVVERAKKILQMGRYK